MLTIPRACFGIVAAICCLALSIPAISAKSVATEKELRAAFDDGDLNGDDVLEIDEYAAYMVRLFDSLDKDNNRILTPDEVGGSVNDRFREIDRNGDVKLSLGEAVGDKVIDFFDADTDRSGTLSFAELRRFEQLK